MGLHLCSLRNLSSFYDSLNSSPGIFKTEAPEVGRALHVHNEMVMKEICKGGNESGLFGHMKMLIEKGNNSRRREGF